MKHYISFRLALIMGALASSSALSVTPDHMQTRGEMLYNTHCIACHTEEVHWREQSLATDWNSLKAQVDRWQSNTRLNWEKDDIVAVTRYLNALYYHFPSGKDDKTISHKPGP